MTFAELAISDKLKFVQYMELRSATIRATLTKAMQAYTDAERDALEQLAVDDAATIPVDVNGAVDLWLKAFPLEQIGEPI